MAGGTKMTLRRYGGGSELDFFSDTIIIDHTVINNTLKLQYNYEPGTGNMEVFLNGQLIHPNIGYREIDENTIQIILEDEDGLMIPLDPDDDVVHVRVWRNFYQTNGSAPVSGSTINEILKRLEEVVNYGGANNLNMVYEYDTQGRISREVSSGDADIIRDFTYTSFNELETERIYFEGQTVLKTYEYDATFAVPRLTKTSVKILA